MSSNLFFIILTAAVATYLTRVLAYIIFNKKSSGTHLNLLQKHMPLVIIIILFFYTFYGVDFLNFTQSLPIILACIFVFSLHLIFKNALLSIVFGTIFYMILLRIF